jgi:hypothetical protein
MAIGGKGYFEFGSNERIFTPTTSKWTAKPHYFQTDGI